MKEFLIVVSIKIVLRQATYKYNKLTYNLKLGYNTSLLKEYRLQLSIIIYESVIRKGIRALLIFTTLSSRLDDLPNPLTTDLVSSSPIANSLSNKGKNYLCNRLYKQKVEDYSYFKYTLISKSKYKLKRNPTNEQCNIVKDQLKNRKQKNLCTTLNKKGIIVLN